MDLTGIKAARADAEAEIGTLTDLVAAIDRVLDLFDGRKQTPTDTKGHQQTPTVAKRPKATPKPKPAPVTGGVRAQGSPAASSEPPKHSTSSQQIPDARTGTRTSARSAPASARTRTGSGRRATSRPLHHSTGNTRATPATRCLWGPRSCGSIGRNGTERRHE